MRKPLLAKWHVRLTIIILCIITAYLVYLSFMDGYREGRQMKMKRMQEKQKNL